MAFPRIKLGEIVNVKGGKRLPKGNDFIDQVTEHPYVRARDIRNGKITFNDPVYISPETHSKIARYIANSGDVCITIVGANVGDVGQVPEFLNGANLTENAVKLLGKAEDYISGYIKYALLTNDAQKQMKNFAAGAAQPKLGIYKINEVEVPYPEYETRKNIDLILDRYDRLIENNNRRIAILEDMAQSLYQEWFVKFRFPGHQNIKFKESSLGLIPEGWGVRSLRDVCNLTMGQSPKSEFYNEEGYGIPFFQGVRDYGVRFPVERIWCTRPTRYAKKSDILFSVRAPVGRLNIAGFDLSIGRGLCAINHKDGFQSFLFQQLKSIFTSEDMMGNGAIFNSVTKSDMEGVKLLSPSEKITKLSENKLGTIFRNLDLLSLKNINLKNQRDLLLPKLISGSINI